MDHKNRAEPQSRPSIRSAIDAWGDMVLRLALARTRNRADAEDVFQTVFIRLFERTGAFSGGEHMKAWLVRVTVNCCNDLARSPWSKNRSAFDEVEEAAGPVQEVPFDLDGALAGLPEKQRVAVHLHYYEGYSTDEIACMTEENPATVRSHLHRARKALKITLGGTDERG